ncbi:MAG: tail-specific protease [Gammaproteobacteria bacterium RIFCSPHIGHO2_12_FULL_63_22]|nr:MAG: tail-specific protease [Gammaproteobacteria bacterium RIFCSPHIGHO2_12_FULL_63_22]
MFNRNLLVFSALLPLTLAIAAANTPAPAAKAAPSAMAPTQAQAEATTLVYGLLSDSRYAYRPMELDDQLSADIFRRYIEALDNDKLFFVKADMDRFAPYRTTLDDAIKTQKLSPAYDIFKTYIKRVDERSAFARSLLAKPFDFSAKESWAYDREKASWAPDQAALNEIWRKYVKNDVLRLKLAGRNQEDIRKTLDKRYAQLGSRVHEMRGDDVFEFFMNAYASSIDPHTSYMSPRSAENFDMQMRLSLQGIGAVLQRQDEFVVIRTLVPGGPAASSGKIKVGDRVVAVGQGDKGPMTDVVDWRIDDVVDQIRGNKGTKVRLDVLPADSGIDGPHKMVTLVRDTIKLEEQAASKSVIDVQGKKIGVITLPGFYLDFEAARRGDPNARSATSDTARLLAELKAQGVDGVVMDLRENGGGSLVEAVELTGLFIDRGPVVQVRESGGRVAVENDDQSGVAWDGPLAVLVNRSSASAAEIFAAAIQDYGRGLIVGEPTFGKGTVQNLIPLDRWPTKAAQQYGQVKLTIAQFFRVDGQTTQHAGVIPEIQFPVTVDASEFGESTFDNALPATRIQTAPHSNLGNFKPIVPRLLSQHNTRVATDREFSWWAQDVAQFKADRDRKIISLNEAERRIERDRDLAKRKQRSAERKALGLVLPGGPEDDDGLQADERNVAQQVAAEAAAKNRPDPLLRETAAILADAIAALSGDAKLAALVMPVTHQATVWSD